MLWELCFARTLAAASSWNAASGFFFHEVIEALITTWWAPLMPMASIKCARSLMSDNSMTSPPKPLLMIAGVYPSKAEPLDDSCKRRDT